MGMPAMVLVVSGALWATAGIGQIAFAAWSGAASWLSVRHGLTAYIIPGILVAWLGAAGHVWALRRSAREARKSDITP